QATVQVYVQGGGGPGPFTGSRPRVQTGSPPQPPYATLPTDRVQGTESPAKRKLIKKQTLSPARLRRVCGVSVRGRAGPVLRPAVRVRRVRPRVRGRPARG